jgi:pyruvate,orthophosphate dikinase
MPETYRQLTEVFAKLESRYRDMQDIEFTIQDGKLWMLQTRSGKRTAEAALKIAVDLCSEGMIDAEEAVMRIDAGALDQLLHPTIDPTAHKQVVARGLPASPGAASGEIVFDADEAEKLKGQGREVILVRTETSPEDIHGMHAAAGILTTRGGMTSHAAVVARGMGRPCVCGAGMLRIDAKAGTMATGGEIFRKGEQITIDGSTGEVLKGRVKMRRPELSGDFGKVMGWADKARSLGVRANADTPPRGEPGARVRRRGHRPVPHRAHVLRGKPYPRHARDDLRRRRGRTPQGARQDAAHAAGRLRGAVRDHGRAAGDDPSCSTRRCTSSCRMSRRKQQPSPRNWACRREARGARVAELHEFNPMLGFRGCRLAIRYPEITEMQARAIFEAAVNARPRDGQAGGAGGDDPARRLPPRVRLLRAVIVRAGEAVEKETGAKLDYQIGT